MRIRFSLLTLLLVTVLLATAVGLAARSWYIDRVLGKAMEEQHIFVDNRLIAVVRKLQAEFKSADDHHLSVVNLTGHSGSSRGDSWDIERVAELVRIVDNGSNTNSTTENLFVIKVQCIRTGMDVPAIKILKCAGPRATEVRESIETMCKEMRWRVEE